MIKTKIYGCCDDPSCPYCYGSGIVEICQTCVEYVENCKCLDKGQNIKEEND
jgi:hypothetical protein